MTLAQLLVVQAHDNTVRQLEHRRANLDELRALEMLDDEQAHLDQKRSEFDAQLGEIRKQQTRLEDDIALIDERSNAENERLYAGTVTAHKDLQLIQEELRVLAERKGTLEEDVLECMEQADPINQAIATINEQVGDVDRRRSEAHTSLQTKQDEIDAAVGDETQARAGAAAEIAPELMLAYEQARIDCGGVGASRLNGKTCEGCHLGLSAVEFDKIRKEPSDALIFHECGRILVRI